MVLKRYPIKVKVIEFIHHGENCTFKVIDTKGKKYLLRIHRGGYHTKEAIQEELKWLESIHQTLDLKIPVPLRSKNSELLETGFVDGFSNPRNCCVFHWIEGGMVWKSLSPKHMHLLGQKMALLQLQSQKRKVSHRNYWHAEGLLGDQPKMGSILNLPEIKPSVQKFIAEQRKEVFSEIKNYERKFPEQLGLIHADMHLGNILFMEDDMGVIDFDDCGYGAYMYDVIVPLIMMEMVLKQTKQLKRRQEYQEAMLEGYATKKSLGAKDIEIISYYKKARRLLMLGWLQSRRDNPRIRAHYKKSVKSAVEYLKKN